MGLTSSQARIMMLTSRKSNVEYRGQQVNQKRMMLAFRAGLEAQQFTWEINPNANGTDPGVSDYYNARASWFHQQDLILELELKNLDTQQKAIDTELDSVKKVIDKNIERSFKTFG